MCVSHTVQSVMIAWDAYRQAAELESIQNALQAYVFYNLWKMVFEFICSCEQRYGLQSQRAYYAVGNQIVGTLDASDSVVGPGAVECGDPVDEYLRYLVSSMLNWRHSMGQNSQFCM